MRRWPTLWWLPSAVVIILAWVNGTMPDRDDCGGTDGPQFACWLDEHPEQLR